MSTSTHARSDVRGAAVLTAGALAYLLFAGSFGYFLVWFAGLAVPRLADQGLPPVGAGVVNLALVGVFGITHSVMARPGYKQWVNDHAPAGVERSLYVAVSSLTLALLTWAWQPFGPTVWHADSAARTVLYAGYVAGVVLVFWVSFLLDHLHLTGVAQTWARFRGRDLPGPNLRTRSLYGWVRHPMNTGLLVLCWSVPTMTGARLQAAALLTGYILVGQWLEERDLHATHGGSYHQYAREVPALVPVPRRKGGRG